MFDERLRILMFVFPALLRELVGGKIVHVKCFIQDFSVNMMDKS